MLRKYHAQYSQIAESQFIKDKSKIGQSEIIMINFWADKWSDTFSEKMLEHVPNEQQSVQAWS